MEKIGADLGDFPEDLLLQLLVNLDKDSDYFIKLSTFTKLDFGPTFYEMQVYNSKNSLEGGNIMTSKTKKYIKRIASEYGETTSGYLNDMNSVE